jgi:HSP20 family protein
MRSFNLGLDVKEGDISAKFKDGVLTLNVPKAEAGVSQPKKISVN